MIVTMATDQWDEFSTRILSPQDKLLFEEAIRSARSGALRAAYIMVWISCAESLKRKFKELSARDGTAKQISGECERKEQAHQSVDHFLLEKARDYGLITATEFTKLEQTYVFRCIYGHPYEMGPNAANLISAASDVIDLVLQKTTKLRHGYLSSQVDNLITKGFFLDDRWEAAERFAGEVAQKCDDSLHWWFLEKLWEKAEAISGDKSLELFFRRSHWFSVAYLRQITIPRTWAAANDLLKFPNTLSGVLATADLFLQLDDHAKEQVLGILIEKAQTNPEFLASLKQMDDSGCFDERMKQRFQEAINSRPLEDLAAIRIDPNLYIERIITTLKTYDWYIQSPAVKVVKNLGPDVIGRLTTHWQFVLGNNILQAADGEERAAISLLNSGIAWPENFVSGVITECFINDENQIRFKKNRMASALLLLTKIDLAAGIRVMLALTERLRGGTVKHLVQPNERDEAVTILQKFSVENPNFTPVASELITRLNGLEIQNPFADFNPRREV